MINGTRKPRKDARKGAKMPAAKRKALIYQIQPYIRDAFSAPMRHNYGRGGDPTLGAAAPMKKGDD